MSKKLKLANDREHVNETHERWVKKYPFNRAYRDGTDYKDEWLSEQCFTCQYYVSLTGLFETDWGVCSNPASPLDGRIMFEHDGCEHHSFAADEESF